MVHQLHVFLSFSVCIFFTIVRHGGAASINSYPYLYYDQKGLNSSFPVLDHIAPIGIKSLRNDRPDFLYNPPPASFRVVEFYIHWCNICRHFSKHYVKYSRKVLQIVAGMPDVAITFHAISCVPNRDLCRQQEIPGYPLFKVFKPGDLNGITMRHTEVKPTAILRQFKIGVDGIKDDDTGGDEPAEGNVSQGKASWWRSLFISYARVVEAPERQIQVLDNRRTREDLMNDVHLSFDFAMRNNVYIAAGDDTLSIEAKLALKEYFILLQRTLPSSWKDLKLLLEQLIRNFRYVSKKEPYLIKFLDKYPPKMLPDTGDPEWSLSCSRGEAGRGFTCGLWETFHAATVGVVYYNRNQVEDAALIAPEAVAKTIRDFIEFFFSCEECRQNFLKMYDTCAFNRCDRLAKKTSLTGDNVSELEWQAVSLWLHEVHNDVNVRLMKEAAARTKLVPTRQDALDAQWPSERNCRPCMLKPDKNGVRKWNETVLYSYLQLEYGQRRDSSAIELRRQLDEVNTANGEEDRRGQPGGLPKLMHSCIFFVCVIGYVGQSWRGSSYLRRVLIKKKLRTM